MEKEEKKERIRSKPDRVKEFLTLEERVAALTCSHHHWPLPPGTELRGCQLASVPRSERGRHEPPCSTELRPPWACRLESSGRRPRPARRRRAHRPVSARAGERATAASLFSSFPGRHGQPPPPLGRKRERGERERKGAGRLDWIRGGASLAGADGHGGQSPWAAAAMRLGREGEDT